MKKMQPVLKMHTSRGKSYNRVNIEPRHLLMDAVNNQQKVAHLDAVQVSLLKENCIQVDVNDRPLRTTTKENCHLMENIRKGLLHRAFSVFLFNSRKELLIQQRSDAKITFPGYLANTCCSHPLYNQNELEETNNIGVKRAAQRRLQQELGISPEEVPLEAFDFVTKIHYQAPYDDVWGEHEIDHILFIQRDVTLKPNRNEVKQYHFVKKENLLSFLESTNAPVTPWFELIMSKFLFKWWNNLDDIKQLQDTKIHRLV